ncbi:hypothetical protein Q5752_004028 [Cryptotrichosporon argae]
MSSKYGAPPQYPQQTQNGQQMYQASDGKWYPVQAMPQNWQGQGQQPGYYGQPQMSTQPVYVQQQRTGMGGMGAGGGILAALCAGLLCFDLGACLF